MSTPTVEKNKYVSEEGKELRALYDIRIKELHHFSATIWAFPTAFGALVAAEYRFLTEKNLLIFAALFNASLCYAFWKHLYNRECVLKALKFIETKVGDHWGTDYIPQFEPQPWYLRCRATTLMQWVVLVVCLLFLSRAVSAAFNHGATNHAPPRTGQLDTTL